MPIGLPVKLKSFRSDVEIRAVWQVLISFYRMLRDDRRWRFSWIFISPLARRAHFCFDYDNLSFIRCKFNYFKFHFTRTTLYTALGGGKWMKKFVSFVFPSLNTSDNKNDVSSKRDIRKSVWLPSSCYLKSLAFRAGFWKLRPSYFHNNNNNILIHHDMIFTCIG